MSDRHALRGPRIDLADETFVRVARSALATRLADPAAWRQWWPDLHLSVTRDRGAEGMQWAVAGALRGSMEVWLEPVPSGTVVHWFLRADPGKPSSQRRCRREAHRRVLAWKVVAFRVKDAMEGVK